MQTAGETSQAFLQDLNALLVKWGAEIEVEDVYGDVRMEVLIPNVYEDGECTRELCIVNLGRWIKGDPAMQERYEAAKKRAANESFKKWCRDNGQFP